MAKTKTYDIPYKVYVKTRTGKKKDNGRDEWAVSGTKNGA